MQGVLSTHPSEEAARDRRAIAIASALLIALALCMCGALFGPVARARAANCPNEALRVGPAVALPDCRAYELVSPPDKNGGSVDGGTAVETFPTPQSSASNGEAVTYSSDTTFTSANPLSSLTNSQYLSERGPDGWSTQAITPAQEYPGGRVDLNTNNVDETPFEGFSEDLTHGFLVAGDPAPVPGAPAEYANPYVLDTDSDSFTLLSTVTPPVQPPGFADRARETFQKQGLIAVFAGFSADSSHVIFQANDALTPNAVPGAENLYEFSAGHLELVSILPDGHASTEDPSFGQRVVHIQANDQHYDFEHAISADGRRVFWTSGRQVYMREDGTRTVEVSASQRTDCADHTPCTGAAEPDPAGPQPATYLTASADGSLVYFTSAQKLTDRSSVAGQDLYQYDANTGKLSDLTVSDYESENVKGAEVEGVLGTSEDGSYLYFAAKGVLAPGATSHPLVGMAPANNVYLWHDGEVRFVATLGDGRVEGVFEEALDERTSRVSPNGRYLAFASGLSLTGYDNVPLHQTECNTEYGFEGSCSEVYEYDAQTNALECASCNPAGLPPDR